MQGTRSSKRKSAAPGLRALAAAGQGFFELDLLDGSAWFSDWFYEKLGWPTEDKRGTLAALEPAVEPAAWARFMARLRDHLERARPLDLEIEIDVRHPLASRERWRVQGAALRNTAGRPVAVAGSMRDVAAEPRASEAARLLAVEAAFEALPVAAALLDARTRIVEANRLWQALPAVTTQQAIDRLKAANSQTAIELWLDPAESPAPGGRPLRMRALAFQHEGARHLAVTLEDRRSD
jgi:PAS domain-containing protein